MATKKVKRLFVNLDHRLDISVDEGNYHCQWYPDGFNSSDIQEAYGTFTVDRSLTVSDLLDQCKATISGQLSEGGAYTVTFDDE